MSPRSPLHPSFLVFIFSSLVIGCGSSVEVIKVKDYRIAVETQHPEAKKDIQRILNLFNEYSGIEILKNQSDASTANSFITLKKGLRNNSYSNHIGYGQWIVESEEIVTNSLNSRRRRTLRYSMNIELDEDYMLSRVGDLTAEKEKEKQVLLFHEIGHGLEMGHHPSDPNDIMFKDVSRQKKFSNFFERVRNYMKD